ncbi:uncharacterized protein LOC129577898 [Sitodiplosis mosellana]|uniref:uncharacterized protein LOC129577898 n=1 Tax=Sitodiplosis mosellana TaxID=263140 RepID=UPI002443F197|nr:uncharacterized protein LOC129577898 [Sitodiplosis mosellana]
MFKLLVLSVLVAVAAAAPSGYHGYAAALPLAYDYTPDYHVSKIVEHIPTAVSHQSRVDYHSKPVITPIYAPVTKVIPQPAYAVHSPAVVAPVVHSAPLVHSSPYYGASFYDAHAHAW